MFRRWRENAFIENHVTLSAESGYGRVCRKGAIYDTKLHNLEELDGILQKCVYENVPLDLVYGSMETK